MKKLYAELEKRADTPEGLATISKVITCITKTENSFNILHSIAQNLAENLDHISKLQTEIVEACDAVSTAAVASMHKTTSEATATSQSIMKWTIGISLAGVLIGILVAFAIILGLIKTLKNLATFASAIAQGEFSAQSHTSEKGEIGLLVSALEQLPVLIKKMITQISETEDKISAGDFRYVISCEEFPGAYKELPDTINRVTHAFLAVIDKLPTAIMTADKSQNIIFLNSTAEALLGKEAIGSFCGDKMNTDICNDPQSCIGCISMEKNCIVNSEMKMDVKGEAKHFEVSAAPLNDAQGKVLGMLEILTDVSQIKTQELLIRDIAHNASEIATRAAAATEELAAQVEQVSRGAAQQREQIESTASAMTEMNATVLEVAKNAAEASERSEESHSNATVGADLVNQVVEAIQNVNVIAVQIQKSIGNLGSQAQEIGGVVNVINDIADQTNLLALNAAIEAARAGEAGRGFAVVADSVRVLAEKTMTATQEVENSISAIQQATYANIKEVETAVNTINQSTELAQASGEALAKIVELASFTSQLISSIATASEEQSATSHEITSSIEGVSVIVGETAEGMSQSAQALQDLSSQVQNLNTLLEELS